jgi:plasmid stability protein
VKNVTVAMDEDLARWVRVKAAEQDVSVSRYLANLLRETMQSESSYNRAMERYLSAEARPLKAKKAAYPSRTELHDRPSLR